MLIKKIPILTNMLLDGVKKKKKMCFLWLEWNYPHWAGKSFSRWGRRRSVNTIAPSAVPLAQGTSRERSLITLRLKGKNDFSTKLNALGKTHSFMRWNSAHRQIEAKGTEPVAPNMSILPRSMSGSTWSYFWLWHWGERWDALSPVSRDWGYHCHPRCKDSSPITDSPLPTQQRRIPGPQYPWCETETHRIRQTWIIHQLHHLQAIWCRGTFFNLGSLSFLITEKKIMKVKVLGHALEIWKCPGHGRYLKNTC